MSELNKCADILVLSGYAPHISQAGKKWFIEESRTSSEYRWEEVAPFADTLESRRQADAIEDWLEKNNFTLLLDSSDNVPTDMNLSNHQWRLDKIKWCINELIKETEK